MKIDPEKARETALLNHRRRLDVLKNRLPERSWKSLMRVPSRYITRLTKALVKDVSSKQAIRAMCEQCVGWEAAAESIGGCRSFTCALHQYRPYQDLNSSKPTKAKSP